MQIHRIFKSQRSAAQASLAILCALFWQASAAQMAPAPSDGWAANPSAKVPAVAYRSVFKETSLGVEKDSTDWRKANDDVGKFTRGHVDILKWEEQEAAKATKANMHKPTDKSIDKAMGKPSAEPDAMKKPAVPPTPETTKPIAAPAHKH
jgi:hypothetical protein